VTARAAPPAQASAGHEREDDQRQRARLAHLRDADRRCGKLTDQAVHSR
jgi:hypothetical protein